MVLEHQIHFDVFFIQISMSHNSIPGSQMWMGGGSLELEGGNPG
jgi:hypothetical protein